MRPGRKRWITAARRSSCARTTCSERSRASRTRSQSAIRSLEALALIGIHRRGAFLAQRLKDILEELLDLEIPLGDLDIGFYRDDVSSRPDAPVVHASHVDFDVTARTVVVVDDVLYTGRTVRAAIEALFDYGRPDRVQLAVLADRGHRELPIRPDYVGKNLPTSSSEHVYRAPARAGRSGRGGDRRTRRGGGLGMNHLLSIEELDRPAIERIVEQATRFSEVSDREIKKVPALRGRMVLNLFYEASTRTRSSFELAAKRLSADVVNFAASGSSVEKGESLKDTVLTLSAHKPDAIVLRTPWAGASELVSKWCSAAIVNAGDGKHEHPTQALLDVYTLRRHLGGIDGASIWIVGDVAHSRVARSNIIAFQRMGAKVTLAGPPTLIPRGIEALGCDVRFTLDELGIRRRGLRAAHAARAHARDVGALAARVRELVSDQRPAPAPAPGAHAPRPGQPRRGALRRGGRFTPGGHHRPGRGGGGRAHGGAV